MTLIPVSLVTGFLGSGKTSLLNALLPRIADQRVLVLVNEFGEIGLDHDLFTSSSDELIVEMSAGCLCCTIRGDLLKTLRDAIWRFGRDGKPWFQRVIIETTGLADPAPILHTLMGDPGLARLYRLDGVLTVVDAVNGRQTVTAHSEAVKQIAVADRLLITKTDLATADEVAELQETLSRLNPLAPCIVVESGSVEPRDVLNVGLFDPDRKTPDVRAWLRAEAAEAASAQHGHGDGHGHHAHDHGHDHDHDINRHGPDIRAFCMTFDAPLYGDAVERWLSLMLELRGPDLLRMKALLNIVGLKKPMVVHAVQHLVHPLAMLPKWPGKDRRSRIVYITRGVPRSVLEDTLRAFNEAEAQAAKEEVWRTPRPALPSGAARGGSHDPA